jgi:hypothetical protein
MSELARAADPLALAARLAALGWPDAEALATAAAATRPDLAAMERTLRARFGARLRDATRAGDRELRREIGLAIDLDNAAAASALAGGGESVAEEDFLAGGRELSHELFRRATETATSGAALALLAGAFSDAAIAGALLASLSSPSRLGERLVAARLVRATAEALQQPLGVAPVLELELALRAEGLALARLVWGFALEAPAAERRGAAA